MDMNLIVAIGLFLVAVVIVVIAARKGWLGKAETAVKRDIQRIEPSAFTVEAQTAAQRVESFIASEKAQWEADVRAQVASKIVK